jgi:hypothetical protein
MALARAPKSRARNIHLTWLGCRLHPYEPPSPPSPAPAVVNSEGWIDPLRTQVLI